MNSDGTMHVTVTWDRPPFRYNQLRHYIYELTYEGGRDVKGTTVISLFFSLRTTLLYEH